MGLESATYISELNSSNPTATDLEAQGDDHLRLLKSTLQATFPGAAKATYIQQAQADVASATTTDIGAATTDYVRITGTTTITGLGTATAGVRRLIRFEGVLTFTHNATSLILPGAANITTAAGDRCEAISLGSGNWIVTWFQPASGRSVIREFASATIMMFGNSSAPTGWTKGSTHNNKAVRLVTGTPSTGGSTGFTSVFASRTILQGNLPSFSLDVSGLSTNTVVTAASGSTSSASQGTGGSFNYVSIVNVSTGGVTILGTLNSGGSGTAMDFAVQYVDMILATKD